RTRATICSSVSFWILGSSSPMAATRGWSFFSSRSFRVPKNFEKMDICAGSGNGRQTGQRREGYPRGQGRVRARARSSLTGAPRRPDSPSMHRLRHVVPIGLLRFTLLLPLVGLAACGPTDPADVCGLSGVPPTADDVQNGFGEALRD